MRRAIFLDRDGVINRKMPEGEYVKCLKDFELLPGVIPALKSVAAAGYLLVIVTNQRGIARGKVLASQLEEIHAHLKKLCAAEGVELAAIYSCPHEGDCACRKPAPGLLLRAAEELGIELQDSWMIGDSPSDIDAGRQAGCRTVYLHPQEVDIGANLVCSGLGVAAQAILERDMPPSSLQREV